MKCKTQSLVLEAANNAIVNAWLVNKIICFTEYKKKTFWVLPREVIANYTNKRQAFDLSRSILFEEVNQCFNTCTQLSALIFKDFNFRLAWGQIQASNDWKVFKYVARKGKILC